MSADGDNTIITLAAWQGKGYDSNSLLASAQTSIFVNPAGADYHLLAGSQAIDKGSSAVSAIVLNDLDLNVRPQSGSYDIGCYEFLQPNSVSGNIQDKDNFIIYPNPFSSSATLRVTNLNELRIEDIKMFNVLGRELFPEIIRTADSFVISGRNFLSGIYFLKIGNTTKKVIISK